MQTFALADFNWDISLVSYKTYSADHYLVLVGSGSASTDGAGYSVLCKLRTGKRMSLL